MPKTLENGVLYVAAEFGAAAHLCACGCGEKVRTPLGPTEWRLEATSSGPSLSPSIGNWQKPCRSHYFISQGKVVWAGAWSEAQVLAGRKAEEKRRSAYYGGEEKAKDHKGLWRCIWDAIKSIFARK